MLGIYGSRYHHYHGSVIYPDRSIFSVNNSLLGITLATNHLNISYILLHSFFHNVFLFIIFAILLRRAFFLFFLLENDFVLPWFHTCACQRLSRIYPFLSSPKKISRPIYLSRAKSVSFI